MEQIASIYFNIKETRQKKKKKSDAFGNKNKWFTQIITITN